MTAATSAANSPTRMVWLSPSDPAMTISAMSTRPTMTPSRTRARTRRGKVAYSGALTSSAICLARLRASRAAQAANRYGFSYGCLVWMIEAIIESQEGELGADRAQMRQVNAVSRRKFAAHEDFSATSGTDAPFSLREQQC